MEISAIETNFAGEINRYLWGYDWKKMWEDRPDLYQTPRQLEEIMLINRALESAIRPLNILLENIAVSLVSSLNVSDRVALSKAEYGAMITQEMSKDKLKENYRTFINYLRKIRVYFVEEKARINNVSRWRIGDTPSENFIIGTSYENLTLRDWLRFVDVFCSEWARYRETFSPSIWSLLRYIPISNLDEFLDTTVENHIKNAEDQWFIF